VAKRGDSSNTLTEAPHGHADALRALRAAVSGSTFPLPVPSAEPAWAATAAMIAQIDDYALSRLTRPDAPLLVGVGGPTGAGKSTTINSLIRAPASATGVLRPTTRVPVLVCHPADAAWFRTGPLLAGLVRTSGPTTDPDHLQVVTATALPAGCAFLDTPDIDSVVSANRVVAAKLLAAVDIWLFVTTAARYADAVPWQVLRTAQQRSVAVAVLLNRVVDAAAGEVTVHLSGMLEASGLGGAPLFAIPESRVDGQGLLPELVVAPVREWFDALAVDQRARADVARQTLDGALAALSREAEGLAAALDDQRAAAEELAERVGMAYGAARAMVERGIGDGALLGGEVLARWREFVGPGGGIRAVLDAGRRRNRLLAGRSRVGRELTAALESSLVRLLRSAITDAVDDAHRAWSGHPAGAVLLAAEAGPDLAVPAAAHAPDGAPDQVARLVYDWRRESLDLVAAGTGGGRARAAALSAGALVLLGATAPEQVWAVAGNDQHIQTVAAKAREDLLTRAAVLIDTEAARYLDRLADVPLDGAQARQVREAAAALESARLADRVAPRARTDGAPVEEAPTGGAPAEEARP
jgi:hypothetical protein